MNWTAFGIFIFYGIIIGVMAFIGFTLSEGNTTISQNAGANLGYALGVMISIILWELFGKKMAIGKNN